MTYTLSMAADQGIRTAADGVAEVSMTDARAHLTQLIRGVRYGGGVAAFTERGQRSAYVVTPDAYEQAKKDRNEIAEYEKLILLCFEHMAGNVPEDAADVLYQQLYRHRNRIAHGR